MATGTRQALTESDILDSLRLRVELHPSDDPMKALREAVAGFGSFMHGPAYTVLESPDPRDRETNPNEPDDVWSYDLRPSEAEALMFFYLEAVEQAVSDASAAIRAAFVRHALEFADAYPDAPRANLEPVTA